MDYPWAVPGQKVICTIGGGKSTWVTVYEQMPVYKGKYTIRDTFIDHRGWLSLRFEEIHNRAAQYVEGVMEPGFWVVGFKPLKPTSIEVFTKILLETPVKAPEAERVP